MLTTRTMSRDIIQVEHLLRLLGKPMALTKPWLSACCFYHCTI